MVHDWYATYVWQPFMVLMVLSAAADFFMHWRWGHKIKRDSTPIRQQAFVYAGGRVAVEVELPRKSTVTKWHDRNALLLGVTIVLFVPVVAVDLVTALVSRDWFSVVWDSLILLWVFWSWIKRNLRRLFRWVKERVAEVGSRLRVVQVPAPSPV